MNRLSAGLAAMVLLTASVSAQAGGPDPHQVPHGPPTGRYVVMVHRGKYNHFWSYRVWDDQLKCYTYFDPIHRCFFYWSGAQNCYLPIAAAKMSRPAAHISTQPSIQQPFTNKKP